MNSQSVVMGHCEPSGDGSLSHRCAIDLFFFFNNVRLCEINVIRLIVGKDLRHNFGGI